MSEEYKKPQINADKRRFVNLNIQRFSEVYPANSLMKSPQSTQRSQSFVIPANKHETAPPSRRGTRMTQIARIFTDQRASASSAKSAFYRIPSAFINAETLRVLDSAHTYAPQGIGGHALQRRDSGRHHLRLIFVSSSDRIEEIPFYLFPIINENGFVHAPTGF